MIEVIDEIIFILMTISSTAAAVAVALAAAADAEQRKDQRHSRLLVLLVDTWNQPDLLIPFVGSWWRKAPTTNPKVKFDPSPVHTKITSHRSD